MLSIKELQNLLEWIDIKSDLNYEEGNYYKMENYCLELVINSNYYAIKLNGNVIMTEDDEEWDDDNDIKIPIEVTAEKCYQNYLKTIQSFK